MENKISFLETRAVFLVKLSFIWSYSKREFCSRIVQLKYRGVRVSGKTLVKTVMTEQKIRAGISNTGRSIFPWAEWKYDRRVWRNKSNSSKVHNLRRPLLKDCWYRNRLWYGPQLLTVDTHPSERMLTTPNPCVSLAEFDERNIVNLATRDRNWHLAGLVFLNQPFWIESIEYNKRLFWSFNYAQSCDYSRSCKWSAQFESSQRKRDKYPCYSSNKYSHRNRASRCSGWGFLTPTPTKIAKLTEQQRTMVS